MTLLPRSSLWEEMSEHRLVNIEGNRCYCPLQLGWQLKFPKFPNFHFFICLPVGSFNKRGVQVHPGSTTIHSRSCIRSSANFPEFKSCRCWYHDRRAPLLNNWLIKILASARKIFTSKFMITG